jgi:beta-glucosidase
MKFACGLLFAFVVMCAPEAAVAADHSAVKPVPRSGGWLKRHERTNNARANSAEEIYDGVAAIVAKLRKELPEMKILVLAIFPRGANDDNKLRQNNMAANKKIAKLQDGKMVHFLDINASFLAKDEKRTLTKEVMPDLLHPREKGYGIWAKAMEPSIAELLGEK